AMSVQSRLNYGNPPSALSEMSVQSPFSTESPQGDINVLNQSNILTPITDDAHEHRSALTKEVERIKPTFLGQSDTESQSATRYSKMGDHQNVTSHQDTGYNKSRMVGQVSTGSYSTQRIPVSLNVKKPKFRKTSLKQSKASYLLNYIHDVVAVDARWLVFVREKCVQIKFDLHLIKTIEKAMRCVTLTPDNCLAFISGSDDGDGDGNGVICIYAQDGQHIKDITTPFTNLSGIACNSDGELVVSDTYTKTISHINYQTGEKLHTTSDTELFDWPHYIAVSNNNNVIVSDMGRDCITVVSRQGKKLLQYGTIGSEEGQLHSPHGVCSDGEHIIVADYWNHRVSLISSDGNFLQHLLTRGDGLAGPMAVTIGHQGNLLVGDMNGHLFEVDYK
ncbi:unnamed protein product, partial [Owenia fusiformis]